LTVSLGCLSALRRQSVISSIRPILIILCEPSSRNASITSSMEVCSAGRGLSPCDGRKASYLGGALSCAS
jgi:hypothetical protein